MDKQVVKVNCVIGIDPGANGGIAIYRPGRPVVVVKMPCDMNILFSYLKGLMEMCSPLVFLEKLTVRADDVQFTSEGVNMGKLYRIQKMIANYEQLRSTLTICEIPFVLVHPMKWQNGLNVRIKGRHEEKADRKRRYRDIAGQLYPAIRATLWNADALLIMHYGRHVLKSDIKWVAENLPKKMHERVISPNTGFTSENG